MKIISKFKDFYDFEVSKYGMDEKLIYYRRTSEYSNMPKGKHECYPNWNCHKHSLLLIGDKMVHLFYRDEKIHSHLELKNIESLREGRILNFYRRMIFSWDKPALIFKDGSEFKIVNFENSRSHDAFGAMLYEMIFMDRNSLIKYLKDEVFFAGESHLFGNEIEKNKLYNEPIILFEYLGHVQDFDTRTNYSVYKRTYNPNLQTLGIYVDPDFVWQSLVDFLSRKRSDKEIVPQVSNEIKVGAHGFDMKTSFRPKMKKKK